MPEFWAQYGLQLITALMDQVNKNLWNITITRTADAKLDELCGGSVSKLLHIRGKPVLEKATPIR